MSKIRKLLSLLLIVVMTAGIAVSGTLAYLTSVDSDVNVMTLGNVKIEQHEYERGINEDGTYKTITTARGTGYKLDDFSQAKPLYPAVGEVTGWDTTRVFYEQFGEGHELGAMDVLDGLENVQDKFVFVENTGKSDAYIRTIIAYEVGSSKDAFGDLIMTSVHSFWDRIPYGVVEINGNNYFVVEYVYSGANGENGRHPDGIVHPGDYTYNNLAQVYMTSKATNEDVEAIDGNKNGTYDILVLSQAIQAAGFENIANNTKTRSVNYSNAALALNEGFGGLTDENIKEWFGDTYIPNYSLPNAEVINGAITLSDGETVVLSASSNASVTVSGEGTLILRDLNINAESGSALTVNGTSIKIVVENDVELTGAAGGHGIYVPANTTLDLSGNGSLTAIGNGGTDEGNGGSGIGGEGTINIHDLEELTAEGWGTSGFGIGGATGTITITNTNISEVRGGYVQKEFVQDPSYGKGEPIGGAAIGSSVDGAVITLTNVNIDEAFGGSKSAGIGATYWTGVTINIDGCDIKNVVGGNASAGIGGSRVAENAPESDAVTINIKNSKVTAEGGQFAAGIGSGYDTHCGEIKINGVVTDIFQPIHTINITGDSVINATGGKYGAGIGTGYHVASLAGEIENTVIVNAVGGGNREKYTVAMDVGFGVIDHSREAKENTSSFDYMGTTITVNSATKVTP